MLPLDLLDHDDPRPWLLLDVDGVLNVFNKSQNQKLYARHAVVVDGLRFPIKMRHALSDWIFELTEHFVPVWCTMWNDAANEYLCPLLELPELAVLPCSYREIPRDLGCHAKVASIEQYVPQDRALAWVDDEVRQRDKDWAYLRNEKTPTTIVKTDERQGLRRDHVDKLIAWAKGIS